MTPSEIISALIAAGTPAEVVVAVSQLITDLALLRHQLKTDDARRARNAARMKQYRESVRTLHNSNATSQRHILKKEEVSKKEKKIYIPADFALNETDLAACREAGWSPVKIETELVRFKDHAAQNARRCADWHAAWRSWVRSPYQTKTNGGMNGHPAKPNASDVLRGIVEETRRRESADFGGLLPEIGRR